jgi:hypothetical protein
VAGTGFTHAAYQPFVAGRVSVVARYVHAAARRRRFHQIAPGARAATRYQNRGLRPAQASDRDQVDRLDRVASDRYRPTGVRGKLPPATTTLITDISSTRSTVTVRRIAANAGYDDFAFAAIGGSGMSTRNSANVRHTSGPRRSGAHPYRRAARKHSAAHMVGSGHFLSCPANQNPGARHGSKTTRRAPMSPLAS